MSFASSGDPFWSSVVCLFHCNGYGGSTTVIDSGPAAAKSYLVSGNAVMSTVQKKFGTASLAVDGTNDCIYPNGTEANFAFGAGDFTVEMFIYMTDIGNSIDRVIYDGRTISGLGATPTIYVSAAGKLTYYAAGGLRITGTTTMAISNWYHVALCRSGTSTRLFLNGTQEGSTWTDTTNYNLVNTNRPVFGENGNANDSSSLKGYMDEIRVTKAARYTANFTPTTLEFPSPTTTDPLWSNVVALFHASGANASTTVVDSSPLGLTAWTCAGNAQVNTAQKQFGTGSFIFDGTGDALYPSASESTFTFGTGDFTVEMFIYPTALGGGVAHILYDGRTVSNPSVASPTMFITTASQLAYFVNGAATITGTTTLSLNTWYHVALCRSGTSTKLFLNGTQEGSTWTDATNYNVTNTTRPVIGANGYASDSYFVGCIDEVRITRDAARYTANFTAPTAEFANG